MRVKSKWHKTQVKIMEYGIMSTPGVIVAGKIAHAGGIPDKETFA
jgi:hypothetical protein